MLIGPIMAATAEQPSVTLNAGRDGSGPSRLHGLFARCPIKFGLLGRGGSGGTDTCSAGVPGAPHYQLPE